MEGGRAGERGGGGRGQEDTEAKWLQGMGNLFKTQIKHPKQRRRQKLNLKDKLLPLY